MAGGPKPKPDDVRGTSTVWKPIVTDSITEDKRGYTKGGHLVMCDDRESWNWQTHYKHIYVPQPQEVLKNIPEAGVKLKRNILRKSKLLQKVDRLRAEAKEAEAAADLKAGYTRPPRTSSSQGSAAAAEAAAKFKQQETYGHQFTFEHEGYCSPLDGVEEFKLPLERCSQLIGASLDPRYDLTTKPTDLKGNDNDVVDPRPLPKPEGLFDDVCNNRTAWYRNVSQVGEVIYGTEYERPGIPKFYRYAPSDRHTPNPRYVSTKAAVDNETVGIAVGENLYRDANPQGRGFRVHGRGHDDTTVSADSPAWIQIPRVTVNKLSCAQLANLVQWKAPLPIQHTEQTMLNSFFGEEVKPRAIDGEEVMHSKRCLHEEPGKGSAPLFRSAANPAADPWLHHTLPGWRPATPQLEQSQEEEAEQRQAEEAATHHDDTEPGFTGSGFARWQSQAVSQQRRQRPSTAGSMLSAANLAEHNRRLPGTPPAAAAAAAAASAVVPGHASLARSLARSLIHPHQVGAPRPRTAGSVGRSVRSARSAVGGAPGGAPPRYGDDGGQHPPHAVHVYARAAPSLAASAAPSIPRSVRSVVSARSTRSKALDHNTEHSNNNVGGGGGGPQHARPATPAEGLAAALRAAAREGGPPPLHPANHVHAATRSRPATAHSLSGGGAARAAHARMSAGATLSAQLKQLSAVK